MHDQYKTFLKILRPVSRYAVDLTLAEMRAEEAEDAKDDDTRDEAGAAHYDLPSSFSIDTGEFLTCLYEDRGDETFILDFLNQSKDLICLVGPKGSGKTSMGHKITRTLSNSVRYNHFISLIDIRVRSAFSNLESFNQNEFRGSLLKYIKDDYMYQLFQYKQDENGENPEVKLWAYILQRTERMPRELFASFWKLQNKAAQLFTVYKEEDLQARKNASYYDWLMVTHNSDAEVKSLTEQIREMVKIPHLVYAAEAIYKYHRQFIWFDNIDAIPQGLQSETVSILKKNHVLVSDFVGTVIAVREENVFRIHDIEENAPPHITRVMIDIERNEKGHAVYWEGDLGHPAIGVPVIKMKVLRKIVNNRLAFVRTLQRSKHDLLELEIQKEKQLLTEQTESQQIARTQQRINELTKDLAFYSPPIDDECFNFLTELSNKMLEVLDAEKAVHLANNSLRDFLMIYRDFLAELLKAPNSNAVRPPALDFESRHIVTLFLRWIRTTPRKFRISTYDVVEETEKWYRGEQAVGCILPHLVITAVWNLTIENVVEVRGEPVYLNPTVGEVVYRLSPLGFSRAKILEAILALHRVEDSSSHMRIASYGHALEFRSSKFINRVEDIADDHIVYVTYRGKCFVGFTCNTFGYLYECVKSYEKRNSDQSKKKKPVVPAKTMSSSDYITEILPYLCDIGQMHYETFKKLRAEVFQNDRDWFVTYCSWFGIPRIYPYKRGNIGLQVKGIRRALQFEALMDGVTSYFREETGFDQLETLQRLFMQSLDRLIVFQESDDRVDFRSQLGLQPHEARRQHGAA